MSNYLKNMWEMMKGLGMWSQYDTYDDYEKKVLHIREEVPVERDIKKELGLDEVESKQFDEMFGNENITN